MNLRFLPMAVPFPSLPAFGILSLALLAGSLRIHGQVIPEGSAMADAKGGQRVLLNPLEPQGVVRQGGWAMNTLSAEPYADLEAKAGSAVLKFAGTAGGPGGKGDFVLIQNPPGEIEFLGAWVFLAPESNVAKVGFQVYDAEGEAFSCLMEADWEGWKWVEMNLKDGVFQQAYPQDEKSGTVEFPLKSAGFVWFAKEAGPSFVGVDAFAAVTGIAAAGKDYTVEASSPAWGEPGTPFRAQLVVNNFTDKPIELDIQSSLQRNPQLYDRPRPDPVLGTDHAEGRPTWLEINGKRIEDASLTDGDEETNFSSPYIADAYEEGFQFIDLGEERKITGLGYRSGDANWIFQVDIAASADGKEYTPVPELQGLDFHKKWGRQKVDVPQPFSARYLRLRYHKGGQKMTVIRSPGSFYVYDGVSDEKFEVPRVGELVEEKSSKTKVPARSFELVPLVFAKPLPTDGYLFAAKASGPAGPEIFLSDYFVPAGEIAIKETSRFGMNGASTEYIPWLKKLGVGWVRFENMKWMFYNPEPGDFRFDGTVTPWVVPFDRYMEQYREAGFSVLPYIFQTPEWATSAPEGITKNRPGYPPKDNADYGKAIFEAVARYGSTTHPADTLKAVDPKSGLNQINTYELWNEPNLNDPGWGFFVGPLEDYLELYRVGAEAVKRADPEALVSNGGFAGLSMEWIDKMRTHKYADGKNPLDFTDVFNVHFYSGREEPELATDDPNANRGGKSEGEVGIYERDLIALADWRDALKPGMPIWLTETGYDVGGPIGRTERYQAAKLPRCLMIAMANGVEKTFVYRETGSKPEQHGGAGVMRDDGSLRPAFFSMATLVRQLDGVTDVRVPRLQMPGSPIWMYSWPRSGGDVLTVWVPEGSAKLGLNLGRCTVTNSFGGVGEQEVGPDFQVGIFPQYLTKIGNPAPIAALKSEAVNRETERKKQLAFTSKAKAYLFDFGSREYVGTKMLGNSRPFTPVLVEDVFSEEKGYGFEEKAPGRNEVRKWVRSPLEKDFIHTNGPGTFLVAAAQGVYEITVKGESFPEGAELVVSGGKEGDVILPLDKTEGRASGRLTVQDGTPVQITIPAGGNIQWLTVVESSGP